MGRLIPTHQGRWEKTLPPREIFEPLIDRTPTDWYWEGDFRDFDGDRLAVFKWGSGIYVVIRALWVYQNNISPADPLHLRRSCAWNACVHPDHTQRVGHGTEPVGTYVLTKPFPLRDGTLVELRESRGRTHLQPADVTHAMCGARTLRSKPTYQVVIGCPACIKAALSMGYELEVRA
jgi:hypothetical protein